MATQVINQVTSANNGNYEPYGAFDPGKIRGLVLTRKGQDLLTTAQLSTVQTSLQAKLEHNTYTSRAFFIHRLIEPEFNGEAQAYQSREQQKVLTDKGTWDYFFTIDGTFADNYQLIDLFSGKAKLYQACFVDENNVLLHDVSTTGIKGFDMTALEVLPIEMAMSGSAVRYRIRVALKDRAAFDQFKHTELGFNPFSELTGVEQVVIAEVQEVSNGVHDVSVRSIDSQENYADLYNGTGELRQVGAWSATLVDGGAAVTITSIAEVLSGTEVASFRFTFDQTTYTNGQVVKLKLASVSTIKGYISNALESNEIEITLAE